MKNRTTPELIETLQPNEIFVFGSNLAGRYGAGAALFAVKNGAKYGQGVGLAGQTFAIPTKDKNLRVLPIEQIKKYVDCFIELAQLAPLRFKTLLVTKIGCGLAGYTPADIAPLFKDAISVDNIYLPAEFWEVLNKENL